MYRYEETRVCDTRSLINCCISSAQKVTVQSVMLHIISVIVNCEVS